MDVIPSFFTRSVLSTGACITFKPPVTYLILANRGSEDEEGDIELILNGGNIDTFLLKYDELVYFGPSVYRKICYKRSDGTNKKVRLDIHAF